MGSARPQQQDRTGPQPHRGDQRRLRHQRALDRRQGSNGVSYNAWDSDTKRWHQFWIGNQPNGVLHLEGGIVDGSMALAGTKNNAPTGKPQRQRITWTPAKDGSVRQHWESSDDDGKTWTTAFDGIYRKDAR